MDKISTQILFKSGKKITNEYRHIIKKKNPDYSVETRHFQGCAERDGFKLIGFNNRFL